MPPAAADLIRDLQGPADAYDLVLVDYLAVAQRRELAGAPLGVWMPAHATPEWTVVQIRSVVEHRDGLCELAVARRRFEQAQAPIITAVRDAADQRAAAARRERYRAEAAADQPY